MGLQDDGGSLHQRLGGIGSASRTRTGIVTHGLFPDLTHYPSTSSPNGLQMIVPDRRRVGRPTRGADDGRWIVRHVDLPDDRARGAIPSRSSDTPASSSAYCSSTV